uniref:Histone-lysine N-methyltransferase, H3 lysine-79 specific n=1 Tax=Amphora coffeiformis TaxID=265554 RepID=A0A7S3L1R3_9STRA
MVTPKTRSPNRGRSRSQHVKSAAARRLNDAYGDHMEDDQDESEEEYDDSSDEESVDSEQQAREFFYSPSDHDPKSMFTIGEFKHLWRLCEKNLGEKTEDIENGRLIRQANTRMAAGDSKAQCKAQYGRILPNATHKLLKEILQVDKDDVFVDVGHGIGNAVLQAAYTVGCESRGIEVVGDRNFIALRFKTELDELRRIRHELLDDRRGDNVGVVELKHGRLELPEYEEFIICRGRRTKAFVNNFDGVFAERSAKPGQNYHLDHFIAGLFAKMSPGSIMVTLHPLTLGHSLESAKDLRSRHGLEESDLASFFHSRTVTLGEAKDVVSWSAGGSNRKPIQVWVYTRLEQPGTEGTAVFLCNNPKCERAINNEPQPAVGIVDADGEKRCVIAECPCGNSARPLRSRRRVDYNSTMDYVQWLN